MADQPSLIPTGIPGSDLPGPYPVGEYAARLRERLRQFARVQIVGEVFNCKTSRARVYFELRDAAGAMPCAMWRTDFEALGRKFRLSRAEIDAVLARDPRRLMDLGVHQYYVPQILRLFFGAAQNSNASDTLECYRRAFPEETAKALARVDRG